VMQATLFDMDTPPRARRTDPETSHEAARKAERFQRGHHKLILDCLRRSPAPFHYIAIATATGLDRHAVGRRIKELSDANLITEGPAGTLPNGNKARTWRVA
jgi:hypothetical protein